MQRSENANTDSLLTKTILNLKHIGMQDHETQPSNVYQMEIEFDCKLNRKHQFAWFI